VTDRPRHPFGAYGIAVHGLESEEPLLVPAAPDWPTVRLEVRPDGADGSVTSLDEHTARYADAPSGHVLVDREAGLVSFHGVDGLAPDAIVHPRLGMIGALYAQWLPGRTAFHAGAFVSGGCAWAVVGERGEGKSTLMAALALAGAPIVGDDTLVLDGMRCLPGARCVDLRPDAAAQLGAGEAVAPVRRGARHRLPLAAPPPDAPLGGWIFLDWGRELALRALPAEERLRRIARSQGWHRRGVTDQARLLDLAALPAWELRRPRDWGLLARIVGQLLELTAGAVRR
jgi:hypothetical protein